MKRSIVRAATLALAGGVVTALSVGVPAHAAANQYAPSIGTLVGTVMTGPTGTAPTVVTSAACPANSTQLIGYVDGNGLVKATAVAAAPGLQANVQTGVQFSFNLLDVALNQGKNLVNGTYDVSLVCQGVGGLSQLAQFDGQMTVTGGVGTGAGTSYAWVPPAAPASTTTLAVSPASPQNAGTNVTLTATVAGPAGVSTAGTVQFMDGATALGAPAATGAGGVATLATAALAVGSHQLTAVFTSTGGALATSTSAATTYVINAAPVNTTTTLTSSPAAPTTADVVTLNATVGPAGATGTVTFTEGAATVGSASVTGGVATLSLSNLSVGTHNYAASFAGTGVYQNSTAAAIPVAVTAFAGASTSETIITTIPAGTLTISAAATPVNMGTAALNATNTLFVAGPTPINNVTITDTRAGSQGWNCYGQVGNFSGAVAGPTHVINGENLGWAPHTVTVPATMTVSAGPAVAPAPGVAIADPGTQGLKSSRLLASSPLGSSIGTAIVGADLNLNAPTTTPADVYTATLTLTAI